MKKIITTDDILNDKTLFTDKQANTIRDNVKKEVAKIKAGRKPAIEGYSRTVAIKVSNDTKKAINYAYSVGVIIDLDDIKLLKYIKEHGLTLSQIQQS